MKRKNLLFCLFDRYSALLEGHAVVVLLFYFVIGKEEGRQKLFFSHTESDEVSQIIHASVQQ
jgi:hypothetical protein